MKKKKKILLKSFFSLIILIATLINIVSCQSKNNGTKPKKNTDSGMSETSYKGPVELTVSVNKKQITLADSLDFIMKIKCENGYSAQLPDYNEKLFGGFIVRDRITLPKTYPDTQTVIISEKYVLDPFLSGKYTITPMEIKFSSDSDTNVYTIESKPLEIEVTSLVDTSGQIPKFKDSTYTIELKRDYKKIFRNLIVVFIIIILAAAGYWYYRKKKGVSKIKTIKLPAHEIAYIQIKKLIEEKLVEQNLIKEFYFKLSMILREYLENRFALKAQEQTTEEFLNEILKNNFFKNEEDKILKNFLEHSDLVKFAKHKPVNEDIQKSFNFVKNFIEKTKEDKKNKTFDQRVDTDHVSKL
ncbi:hypothetical protein KA977_10750 [Candidatus Dependentiae bacterium]|nr:hypothetical protein [Candidatus Dependentiae bacterium]